MAPSISKNLKNSYSKLESSSKHKYALTQELRSIYDHFDKNRDGRVSFQEFIDVLKSDMAPIRENAIRYAYNILDHEARGYLIFDNLRANFIASEHPLVRMKELTLEQVMTEFDEHMGSLKY